MYAKLERKVCKQCSEEKDLKQFRFRKDRIGRRRKPGYETYCLGCEIVNRKKRYERIKPEQKRLDFSRNCLKFGLTTTQYEEMVKLQNGKCAICSKPEIAKRAGVIKNLAIDHCHKTGRVRSLLCTRCNTAIGLLREDVALFQSTIRYLEKFKSQG